MRRVRYLGDRNGAPPTIDGAAMLPRTIFARFHAGAIAMYIGITADILDKHFAVQRQGMWCWAACIQMLFRMHGVHVSQEMIVKRSFGLEPWGTPPNKPGGVEHMFENLNHFGIDAEGKHYVVAAALIPGPPPPQVVLRELTDKRPILLSYASRPNMNHAVLLTAADVVEEEEVKRIKTFVVRDPWPTAKNIKNNGRIEHRARSIIAKTTAHWLVRIAR